MPSLEPTLERRSPLPLYRQLTALLRARIRSGEWRPGDRVPGDQELMERYGVSRTTVRQAFRELELAGLVSRERGRGSFVARPKLSHTPDSRHRLGDSLRSLGLSAGWRLLDCASVPAGPTVASRLQLREGTEVCRLRRLRLADGEPIGIHDAHTARIRAESLDPARLTAGESLDYLVPPQVRPELSLERTLEAVPAEQREASLLGVAPGAPLLRVRRLTRDARGEPLEDLVASYRGDRFQYLTSTAPDRTLGPG